MRRLSSYFGIKFNIIVSITTAGFSIEGGTRRLIAAYFGIYFVFKSLFFALF